MDEFLKLFSVRDIGLHLINTLILFIAIRFLVYKPVRKFMNARTERVERQLSDATEAKKQASAELLAAESTRKNAEAEAAKAQIAAAESAHVAAGQALSQAKSQAETLLRKARADAEAEKAQAQTAIAAQALSMAVEIAEKMIGRELSQKDNDSLARAFLTKVV